MSTIFALMAEKSADRKLGLGRLGTLAGVLAGLAAGIGLSVVHSVLSASGQKPEPSPVASVTAIPLPNPVATAVDSVSFAEQLAEHVKAHQESIARHDREPRDPLWATQTEQVVKDLLAKLASRGKFRITSVDCRTASCVAYLSAASYEDARQAWPTIVNARNDTKCGIEITLNEPQPGESTFDFSAVYDCIQIRQLQGHGK